MLSTKKLLYKIVSAIKQLQDTKEYEWKFVSRTVSHPAGTNYFSTQVDFPAKSGYTRKPTNYHSDNANVIIVGMYIDYNTSRAHWRTNNVSSSTQSATLSCDLVYVKDDRQWT